MLGEGNELSNSVTDIGLTEKLTLFPLAFMVLAIGVYPNIFLKVSEPAMVEILKAATNHGLGLK